MAAGDLSDPHGTHRVCAQAIFRALENTSAAEVDAIRAAYRDHYGRDLDEHLADQLDDDELVHAGKLLSGDRAVNRAATLRDASEGSGTKEDAFRRVLRGVGSTEELTALELVTFMAQLSGVPAARATAEAERALVEMGLKDARNRRV